MTNENKEALRSQFKAAYRHFNALRVEGEMEVVSMATFTEMVLKALRLNGLANGHHIRPEHWVEYAEIEVLELAYDLNGDEWGMADAERNEI